MVVSLTINSAQWLALLYIHPHDRLRRRIHLLPPINNHRRAGSSTIDVNVRVLKTVRTKRKRFSGHWRLMDSIGAPLPCSNLRHNRSHRKQMTSQKPPQQTRKHLFYLLLCDCRNAIQSLAFCSNFASTTHRSTVKTYLHPRLC